VTNQCNCNGPNPLMGSLINLIGLTLTRPGWPLTDNVSLRFSVLLLRLLLVHHEERNIRSWSCWWAPGLVVVARKKELEIWLWPKTVRLRRKAEVRFLSCFLRHFAASFPSKTAATNLALSSFYRNFWEYPLLFLSRPRPLFGALVVLPVLLRVFLRFSE
jgi:hypothetical protein